MEHYELEDDPIIKDLCSPETDAETRKLIKIALCDAVIRGNFHNDLIEVLVNALSPKELTQFCKKLLFGSKNEKEYLELTHGGRVLQVLKILQNGDAIKSKRNGQKCYDDILDDVIKFRVLMTQDIRQGKQVCYRNAYFLDSIFNTAAHGDKTKYAHDRQMTQWMIGQSPDLGSDEEEVAFENIYEFRSEDIGAYDDEKFWTRYEQITGLTD